MLYSAVSEYIQKETKVCRKSRQHSKSCMPRSLDSDATLLYTKRSPSYCMTCFSRPCMRTKHAKYIYPLQGEPDLAMGLHGWSQQRTPLSWYHQLVTQHCQDTSHWPWCCTCALVWEPPQPMAAMPCRLHCNTPTQMYVNCNKLSSADVNHSSTRAHAYSDTINIICVPGKGCRPCSRVVPSPYPCPWLLNTPASKTWGTHWPHKLCKAIRQLVWCFRLWCLLESRLATFKAICCPEGVLK